MKMLQEAGLNPMLPKGAYYIMCDIGKWGYPNDIEFAKFLVTEVGVATVPGSSFFRDPAAGKNIIRFTFCKKEETLNAAEERLKKLHHQSPAAVQ
jgi:aminotransferase